MAPFSGWVSSVLTAAQQTNTEQIKPFLGFVVLPKVSIGLQPWTIGLIKGSWTTKVTPYKEDSIWLIHSSLDDCINMSTILIVKICIRGPALTVSSFRDKIMYST